MATFRKRTANSGENRFQAIVRVKGYPAQTATFNTEKKAQKWARQTEVAIEDGRHFKTAEAKNHTFGEMIDRYLKHVIPRKSPRQRSLQTTQLKWWKSQLGPYTLADVTTAMLVERRDDLSNQLVSGDEQGGKKRSNLRTSNDMA